MNSPDYLSLTTAQAQYQPFQLRVTVVKGKNLPVGDVRTSDPYVVLKVGNTILGRTSVVRWSLSPKWNETFETPLLHLTGGVLFEIWDHDDVGSHKMLGRFEISLQDIPTGVESTHETALEKGSSKIEPRGSVSYTILITSRDTLISVKTVDCDLTKQVLPSVQRLADEEFADSMTAVTIQDAFKESGILCTKDLNWSLFRDMLYDVNLLSPAALAVVTQSESQNIGNDSDSTALRSRLNHVKPHRAGSEPEFVRSVQIDLMNNTTRLVPPQRRNSILVRTRQHMYTLVAPNKFMMWAWVRAFRRSFVALHLRREQESGNGAGDSSVGIGRVHRSHHVPEIVECEPEFRGNLSVQIEGQLYDCACVLRAESMHLECQELKSGSAPVSLNLHKMDAITVSMDYSEHLPYDLKVDILSGKLSVNTIAEAVKRNKKASLSQETIESGVKQTSGGGSWYPGKFVVKGASMIVKTAVKGTVDGTNLLVKGTAGIASTAAEGIVTVATLGMSGQDEVGIYSVLNSPSCTAVTTRPVSGIAPYWDKPCIVNISEREILAWNNVDEEQATGLTLHLLSESGGEESIIGSKFVYYKDLIPPGALESVCDYSVDTKGGTASDVIETTVVMDNEIAYRVEVLKGVDLLPPPGSNTINTILTHPLDSLVSLSTIATSAVGITKSQSSSNDRNTKVTCSFADWDGSRRSSYKSYRSRVIQKSLCPEWNECFFLTANDGLHTAKFIKLVVTDDSRSGRDHLMGAVYIPKEEFYTKAALSGSLMKKRYPVEPVEGMSPSASLYHNGLGFIEVRLQLMMRECEFMGTKSICAPEITLRSQLVPSNEHTTYWFCDCVTSFHMSKTESDVNNSVEQFIFSPGFDGLVLQSRSYQGDTAGDEGKKASMLLHHFQRKSKTVTPAGFDGTPPIVQDRIEYHVFQNQRRSLNLEWGGSYLLKQERREFTDESGTVVCPFSPFNDSLRPPEGYTWEGDSCNSWVIDREYTNVDADGWCYGIDFGWIMSNYRKGESSTNAIMRSVRRRRFKRVCTRTVSVEDSLSLRKSSVVSSQEQDRDEVEPPTDEYTLIEVFENQRRSIMMDWGKNYLFSGVERGPFTDETGEISYNYHSLNTAEPPPGYKWVPDYEWTIDTTYTNTDEFGWVYGIDFNWIMSNLKKGKSTSSSSGRSVRRRKWVRRAQKFSKVISAIPLSEASDAPKNNGFFGHFDFTSGNKRYKTKLDVYHDFKELVVTLCRERDTLDSPVIIPWNQVLRVDVVTPSVLSVIATVHRYFGESSGNEIYRPAEVEIFVVDCPAEKLCLLVRDRLHLKSFRENVALLTSSGSMTGDPNHTSYVDDTDASALPTTKELSLGSSTILFLDTEVTENENEIVRLEKYMEAKEYDVVQAKWLSSEIEHLRRLNYRIKLYIAVLLGAGLMGPSYEVDEVRKMIARDKIEAERIYLHSAEQDDVVYSAKQIVSFLLDTAEMRIRDTALCGWSHQGKVLEECLGVIINGYYILIVGALGRFFDSKEKLLSMKGNESKIQLIQFFLQNDAHLSTIVKSSLRLINIEVDPEPLLSLSLNIKTMIFWYTEVLVDEMKKYVHNTFEANRTAQVDGLSFYKLPWLVVSDGEHFISNIPSDIVGIVNHYLSLVRMRKELLSKAVQEFLHFLDERIRIIYVDCFVALESRYSEVLYNHDWTTPVPTPGVTFDDEMEFQAVGMHVKWLSSIANDSHQILNKYIKACVESGYEVEGDEYNRELFAMSPESASVMGQSMYQLTKLLSANVSVAMDFLTCIMFKSFDVFLPTTRIYDSWTHSTGQSPQLVKRLLAELNSYINDFISTLECPCFEKVIEICLRKVTVWYLNMFNEASNHGIVFRDDDVSIIRDDCNSIREFFSGVINRISDKSRTGSSKGLMFGGVARIEQLLQIFTDISVLLTEPIGSVPFTRTVCLVVDQANTEHFKANALKNLVKAVFKLRGGRSSSSEEFNLAQTDSLTSALMSQLDDMIKKHGNGNSLPTSLLVDPPPEYVVFQINLRLEKYLIGSAVYRCKKEKELAVAEKRKIQKEKLMQDKVIAAAKEVQQSSRRSSIASYIFGHKDTAANDVNQSAPIRATSSISDSEMFSENHTSVPKMNIIEISNISVSNLYCLDRFAKTDVYIEFSIQGKKCYTDVKTNTLNPVWGNSPVSIPVEESMIEGSSLVANVYYKVRFRMDIKVGSVTIALNELKITGDLPVEQHFLDCSKKAGTSKEILRAQAEEDKRRSPPVLTLSLSTKI